MEAKLKSGLVVAGLLAVILVTLVMVIRQVRGPVHPQERVDWVCEGCEHFFTAPYTPENSVCPLCGGESVKTYIFYDADAGELFEFFRERPIDPEEPDRGELVKVPGGNWMRPDPGAEARYGFPVRPERTGDIRYAPPGSEYR